MNTRAQEFLVRLLFRKWRKRYARLQIPQIQVTDKYWAVGKYSAGLANPFTVKMDKPKHILPNSRDWELPPLMKLLTDLGFKYQPEIFRRTMYKYYVTYDGMLCGKIYDMR